MSTDVKRSTRTRHVVCGVDELAPGDRRLVKVGRREIGVFNISGELYALANICPHHSAPVCQGSVGSAMLGSVEGDFKLDRDGFVLRCPWHRFKFDITTGRSLQQPERYRIATYEARQEGNEVVVYA